MTEIDDTDRRLIAELSRNARLPVAKLATKLGLARTTVQARIDKLERNGVIAGYTLRLSEQVKRGMIRATVLLHIRPSAQGAIVTHLARIPQVETAHTTSGRCDLSCLLRTETTLELDQTLDRIGAIDGVEDMETLVHLSTKIDRPT